MKINFENNIINIDNGNSINIIPFNLLNDESIIKYLVIIKKDSTILFSSDTFNKLIGINTANKKLCEVLNKNIKLYEQLRKMMLECLFTNKLVSSEFLSETSNRIFKISMSPIFNNDEILMIAAYDITKTKLIYDEIEELKNKLLESNSIKNIFLSNISHELRTPMNTIIGFSNILIENKTIDYEKRFIRSINSNAKYLDELLNNILDSSKIESNEFDVLYENFSIKDLFDELKDLFEDVNYKKNSTSVKLEFTINEDKKIISDYLRLKQVLFNIISNSIKFTNKGYIKIDFNTENNFIIFKIEDTGIGIPEDKIKFVFDRFWQIDSSSRKKYKGVGLGLPVSKKITELLGGDILIKSIFNSGTTFFVKIPLEEIKHDVLLISKDKINFSGKTVLILDELPVKYSLLGIYLNSLNISIISPHNETEAIKIFKKQKEKIDLIIIDLNIFDINIFKIAKKFKDINNNCNIILKSSKETKKSIFIDYYLKKPLIKNELLKILNNIWQK